MTSQEVLIISSVEGMGGLAAMSELCFVRHESLSVLL